MRTYRYRVDLRCYLRNGDVDVIRNYRIAVDAYTEREARQLLPRVAADMVEDEGSHLLDAPLDDLEVIQVDREDEDD